MLHFFSWFFTVCAFYTTYCQVNPLYPLVIVSIFKICIFFLFGSFKIHPILISFNFFLELFKIGSLSFFFFFSRSFGCNVTIKMQHSYPYYVSTCLIPIFYFLYFSSYMFDNNSETNTSSFLCTTNNEYPEPPHAPLRLVNLAHGII